MFFVSSGAYIPMSSFDELGHMLTHHTRLRLLCLCRYGSTIAGLQVTRALPASMVQAYYDEVWQDLDYTTLLAQAAGTRGHR